MERSNTLQNVKQRLLYKVGPTAHSGMFALFQRRSCVAEFFAGFVSVWRLQRSSIPAYRILHQLGFAVDQIRAVWSHFFELCLCSKISVGTKTENATSTSSSLLIGRHVDS